MTKRLDKTRSRWAYKPRSKTSQRLRTLLLDNGPMTRDAIYRKFKPGKECRLVCNAIHNAIAGGSMIEDDEGRIAPDYDWVAKTGKNSKAQEEPRTWRDPAGWSVLHPMAYAVGNVTGLEARA